jgi:hypothetical protein
MTDFRADAGPLSTGPFVRPTAPTPPMAVPTGTSVVIGEPWEALPPVACTKYRALADEVEEVRGIVDALADERERLRLVMLDQQLHVQRVKTDTRLAHRVEIEAAIAHQTERLDKATAEFNRAQARFEAKAALWAERKAVLAALDVYLRQGGPYEAAPNPNVALAPGKAWVDVVSETRARIAELAADRQSILDAPVHSSRVKAKARALVDGMAAKPNPMAALEGDGDIELPAGPMEFITIGGQSGNYRPRFNAMGFLMWACREAVIEKMDAIIDEYADDACSLSDDERAKRLSEVDRTLLSAGRAEEFAIMQAQAAGVVIPRRADADPRCVLCVNGPAPRRRW